MSGLILTVSPGHTAQPGLMAQTSSVRTSLGYLVIVVPIATAFQSLEDQVQPDFLRGWSASLAKAAMATIKKQSNLCPVGGSGRAQKSPVPFQLWKTCSVRFPHAGQKQRAPSQLGPVDHCEKQGGAECHLEVRRKGFHDSVLVSDIWQNLYSTVPTVKHKEY